MIRLPHGPNGDLDQRLNDVDMRLSRLVQVPMTFDASQWPPQKKELLKTLLEAGRALHEAYLHQWLPEGIPLRDSLELCTDELSAKLHRLVVRNGGPFDKMDDFAVFAGNDKKAPGCAFYPPDMTRREFEASVDADPDQREKLMSPYTVVRREGGKLVPIPFHRHFAPFVESAAMHLRTASQLAESPALRKFLASRAEALTTDDYYLSDLDWIELDGSEFEMLIGPYEMYDDGLMGLKASYEVAIGVRNKEESERLEMYGRHLDALEQYLPNEQRHKRSSSGLVSPMVVVTDLFRGGDVATGYQAVAANLPNDPRVHVTKGTKKTFWKNMMDARMEHITTPLGRAMISPDQISSMTSRGMFSFILLHELSHALGPRYVGANNNSLTVNQALKDHHMPIEEAKADMTGLHSMRYFIEKGIIPRAMEAEHYVSYLASILRSIRFGSGEAHGMAAICEFNFLRARGALSVDSLTGKWSVVNAVIPDAVSAMAGELLAIQSAGDRDAAAGFLQKWGTIAPEVKEGLRRLDDLPVDIEPVYSIRWN